VIDIGSNSVLLLAVRLGADGRARALEADRATTRLGAGLRAGGALDPEAWRRTAEAVEVFAARARAVGAEWVWAFATGAVRDAADGAAFARAIEAASGVPVEVLSGAQEARLAYAAVVRALARRGPLLVADVGGRTTELTLGAGHDIVGTASLPLGALALTEACLREDPPDRAGRRRMADVADAALAGSDLPARARTGGAALAASGGTATALAALDLGLPAYDARRVHGHELSRAALAALGERLAAMPLAERAALPSLGPERAAILPAGAVVLERVAEAAGAGAVCVSDHGVRHGYLHARLAAAGVEADLNEL
jgi:exopolyphosphatase/guanosine-5'-triphosphate,3'-diphosphate pyrophosphatase